MAYKVLDSDLVVISAGGSGLVAPVEGGNVSGKKVIVFEKANKPGGDTNFAGGLRITNSKWQRAGCSRLLDMFFNKIYKNRA
jgi:ribulose 1,5-bisphosphate synthetase/thiazole synthase